MAFLDKLFCTDGDEEINEIAGSNFVKEIRLVQNDMPIKEIPNHARVKTVLQFGFFC